MKNRIYFKIISILMASLMVLSGCKFPNGNKKISSEIVQQETSIEVENPTYFERSPEEQEYVQKFKTLDEEELLRYVEDSIYADLDSTLDEATFEIENVQAIYISKEYIEEYTFNTRSNIYFGYTLEEVEKEFKGKKYVFSLGEDGRTVVKEFEGYDDTYEKVIRNVAIGTGVILICVTVAVVTDGVGAPASVCAIFAASAKGATTMALSTGIISGVFEGVVTGIQTGDMDKACKAGALSGSEGFMWGAISGALIEGGKEAFVLAKGAGVASETGKIVEEGVKGVESVKGAETLASDGAKVVENVSKAGKIRLPWQLAEDRAIARYGGEAQCSYLDGVVVPKGTPGSTRPDVVRNVGGKLEAIEVKYYDLESSSCFNEMINILRDEVRSRSINMPKGTTQRVVIDVTGRGYSKEFVNEKIAIVADKLDDIYPNIPIDIEGL